jgi:hypothetical protein
MRSKFEKAFVEVLQDLIHTNEIEYDNDGQPVILDSIELGDFYVTLNAFDKNDYENAPEDGEGNKDLNSLEVIQIELDITDGACDTIQDLIYIVKDYS